MTINTETLRLSCLCAAAILALSSAAPAFSATLSVGPGKAFSTPCRAFAAASNGDTVEIDASGSYNGDVCGINPNNLTIRGVNGRPKINANGANAMGKGTWVVKGANTVIENVEMFGATVPDQNGAAIRLDGNHLTLRGSYLHHNENGILTGNDGVSNVVVENSEFASNGFGDGFTHNLYIGHINSLIFRGNYSRDAHVGHNLKSRANTNTIVYNRFSSSVNQPSYEIDLPNAGTSYVIGNVIQQSANNGNATLLAYGREGASNTGRDLYVINNTFLNEDSVRGTFVGVGDTVGTPVLMQNNIFSGTGSVSNQSSAIDRNNHRTLSPDVVDLAGYDLHPVTGSPMIGAGADPGGSASGVSLMPTEEYKFPVGTSPRPVNGSIDIGAYAAIPSVPDPLPPETPPVVPPVVPPVTPVPDSTGGWTPCASEGGTCSFDGTRQVRYGVNGAYSYRTATSSIACNNGIFSDPAYGVVKSCSYSDATTAPGGASVTMAGWTVCAPENGGCIFDGTRQVLYGANGSYNYRTATGAIACGNSAFGDPLYGVVKSCLVSAGTDAGAPALPAGSAWVYCAAEGGTCSFPGTRQMRFGAVGVYVYKSMTSPVSCSNSVFGDPIYGIVKTCSYVAKATEF